MINILTRVLLAVLNGIITYIVLALIVALLVMVGFSAAAVIERFIFIIAVIVGILTFLGAVPNYWSGVIK